MRANMRATITGNKNVKMEYIYIYIYIYNKKRNVDVYVVFCHFGDWFVATNRGNHLESILLREPGLHCLFSLCV